MKQSARGVGRIGAWGMCLVTAGVVTLGCGKKDATADPPAEAPAATAETTTNSAPLPSGVATTVATPATDEPNAATAEESRQADIGAYTPVVPNPSMTSKLPCPPGTTQSNGDHVLECRSAGAVGKALSKRQGPSLWFHKNGKVHRVGSYERHEWTGRWWDFDEEGRPSSSSAYRDGREEGVHVTFHPNGKRKSETPFKEGKMTGTSKVWTEEGELMGLTVYADDKVVTSKTFKYKMKPASADELKKMNEEIKKLLDDQKKEMEKVK